MAESHPQTASGENTSSTRQPTQLSVLLAGAGTPPLEPEAVRLAPIRLWDAFVLSPERARLFFGDARALFSDRPETVDLRHDALARALRAIASSLRQRLNAYDNNHPQRELLRGASALTASRIENELVGVDSRRGGTYLYSARHMLGSPLPDIDPLESPDAGVLRRVLALAMRGLALDKPGTRGGGVVTDLGAVTLTLSLLDLAANPRSALRAARARLSKTGRLDARDGARVRDVGHALREVLQHAVSGATSPSSAARDLVKDATLPGELLEHMAVSLARAVYDGLGPGDEHPLIVPGAEVGDVFSAAPALVSHSEPGEDDAPTLGLYNRIVFVAMPYAALVPSPSTTDSRLPPRPPSGIDENSIGRVREAIRSDAVMARLTVPATSVFATQLDAVDPRGNWTRMSPRNAAGKIVHELEQSPPGTYVVLVSGPRSATGRETLDALATSLGTHWHCLAPRTTDRTLVLEPLEGAPAAGPQLRRADVSRWLDAEAPRLVHWDAPAGARVVINAAALPEDAAEPLRALFAIVKDLGDRADPRAIVLVLGAPTYRSVADVLSALGAQTDLETGEVPLRSDAVWLLRTDVPFASRAESRRGCDETLLNDIAESLAPSPLAAAAVRSIMLPTDGHARGRAVRLAALGGERMAAVRQAVERASVDPWSGRAMRRCVQAGFASRSTGRALLACGMSSEAVHCVQQELALLVAEWDGARDRAESKLGGAANASREQTTVYVMPQIRIADLARGQLLEMVTSVHSRVSVLADDALASRLARVGSDFVERASVGEALHASALGARPAGTVYATDDARGVPLGFLFRGGTDLYALVDVTVGSMPARVLPSPQVELVWRVVGDREGSLAFVADLLLALHDNVRRWQIDAAARPAVRDGRTTYGALVDVSIDARLVPDSIRISLPLRIGTTEVESQRFAVDVVAAIADATGTSVNNEWTAQGTVDSRGVLPIALTGPMLLREFQRRWLRALRLLPRPFPTGAAGSATYLRAPALSRGVDLGLIPELLAEHGIAPGSHAARAVLTRLAAAAAEVRDEAKQLAAGLPLRPSSLEGPDHEVIERQVAVAWFLHSNFCTTESGPLRWQIDEGRSLQSVIDHHLDRTAIKLWLQRKMSRPAVVDARIAEFLSHLEPTIVVER